MAGDNQFVEITPDSAFPFVEVDIDPDFLDTFSDLYLSALVYIPSSIQADLAPQAGPQTILQSDSFSIGIFETAGNYYWWSGFGAGANFALITFDTFTQVEWHAIAGASTYDVRINGTLYTARDSPFLPASGINYLGVNGFPFGSVGDGGGTLADDTIGVDELTWSATNWVSLGGTVAGRWAFDGADPLGDAPVNYPDPPWFVWEPTFVSVETGGGENADAFGDEEVDPPPDPVGCCADDGELQALVFIDGTDVTNVSVAGSWTPQLNGVAQASVTIPMDAAIGDCGDLLRIEVWDGVSDPCIVFHGRILNRELDTDKDGGRVVYNAQDASEILQYRVVRDDDGDFSKPRIIEQYMTGPQIIQAMLINTVDSTGRTSLDGFNGGPPPLKSEGPLPFILGGFAGGGPSLKGAPVDWPMKISELISLLVSTGQVDCIFSPINPGGGITARLDVYNGNYGVDRSGSVAFQYGTGLFNAASVRWNRDMTTIINKYQIFAGPQIETAGDPKGEQHWCFNVQGFDGGSEHVPPFPGPPDGLAYLDSSPDTGPGGQAVDTSNNPLADYTNNPLGERIFNSRQDFDVRMQVDILDAYDDNCVRHVGTPGRMLTRYQWQIFSWLAAQPRELIHITPVAGTQIGCFGIGDLIHVEAASDVGGGFSGSQRVYGYTVSWEGTPSVLTLSEISTSADSEVPS